MVKIYETDANKVEEEEKVEVTQSEQPPVKKRRSNKKVAEPVPVPDEIKVKKERTPAQIAAAEKRKATYALNKQLKEAIAEKEAEEARKLEEQERLKHIEIQARKELQKQKRREAMAARKQEKESLNIPAWFESYLASVKKTETAEKENRNERREILKEIEETAKQQWVANGANMQKEVDHHKNKMFSMIFPRRAAR